MRKFLEWSKRYDNFRNRLDRGEVEDPWDELSNLERLKDSLAMEGIDLYEIARCLCLTAKANNFFLERKFNESLLVLSSAEPKFSTFPEYSELILNEIHLFKGNIYYVQQRYDEAIDEYQKTTKLAGQGLPNAHAEFNLGNCFISKDDLATARIHFLRAGELYAKNNYANKVADVFHQLGNIAKFSGNLDEAISKLHKAGKIYLSKRDMAGSWRIWDDLARVYFSKSCIADVSEEEREKWAHHAFDASLTAAFFMEQLWRLALSSEGRMADLSDQFANHTITLSEIALYFGRLDIFLGSLAYYKGRIRNSANSALPSYIKSDKELSGKVEEKVFGAIVESIAGSCIKLSNGFRKIAVVDQLVFHGIKLFIGVYYVGNSVSLEWYESELPIEPNDHIYGSRGKNRVLEAHEVINRYLLTMESHSKRCSYLLGSESKAQTAEDRAQLQEWARELDGDSRLLGPWFFPKSLLDDLITREIGHLVLIPDPAFANIPYLALETENGLVNDQPWSLSIVTSAMELLRMAERTERIQQSKPITWIGPDDAVNVEMGGNDELEMLNSYFETEPQPNERASIEGLCAAIGSGRWVHFRGHGRWNNNVDESGLVFSNKEILNRRLLSVKSNSPGFLVTAACRTGFSEFVGTELFGLLSSYEAGDMLGAILSSWPIHGPATTVFMKFFYQYIHQGRDVARALQLAAREAKIVNPHPYLWAPFFLIGYWLSNTLVKNKEPSNS